MKNILIVFGGNSFEHEVSIKSASNLYNYIDRTIFNVNSLYISKEGIWYEFDNNFEKSFTVSKLTVLSAIDNSFFSLVSTIFAALIVLAILEPVSPSGTGKTLRSLTNSLLLKILFAPDIILSFKIMSILF